MQRPQADRVSSTLVASENKKEKRNGLLRYPQFTLAWKRTAPNSKAQGKVSWGHVAMKATVVLLRPEAVSPGEACGVWGVRKAERPHAYASRNCTWKSLTFCRTIFSFSMGGRMVILPGGRVGERRQPVHLSHSGQGERCGAHSPAPTAAVMGTMVVGAAMGL